MLQFKASTKCQKIVAKRVSHQKQNQKQSKAKQNKTCERKTR